VSQNSVPGIQLAHAGRKASISMEWWTKGSRRSRRLGFSSSSGIAYHESEKAPIALDENGIHKVIV
jgi:2,4-dienoyl-CoA reductase-like NADH-dependent reductase (Old Yellow Enzyme family)